MGASSKCSAVRRNILPLGDQCLALVLTRRDSGFDRANQVAQLRGSTGSVGTEGPFSDPVLLNPFSWQTNAGTFWA